MEFLSTFWGWILTTVGGISLAGIITAILYGCLKGAFAKTVSKINVEKIAEKATEKGIERVKKVSFTHNIQPLVESELSKINEKSVEVMQETLKEVQEKYDQLIDILDGLAKYFDNSIGVPEDKKTALREKIAKAQNKPVVAESVVVDELDTKVEKKSAKAQNESLNSVSVER